MSGEGSPYLDGRREWLERYGSYITRARNWRVVALSCLLVAAISVVGVVALAMQVRVVPYVVEVDGRARAVGVYPAERLDAGTPALWRAAVARWVEDWRTVSADAALQRAAIDRVYAHLSRGSAGTVAVSGWYRDNSPFERATQETVVVEVEQVLQLEGDTWRVEWTETPRARSGEAGESGRVTATMTLARGPVDENAILSNPLGLYIAGIDWSREFSP